ncbi:hypothetical protein [Candidatus Sulfurimonas baltica]|uniref:VWA domain-containing protein n=1 Tax=Candidatus Sulfurimonas baltica TaxID=2740404 RepID=A0A7S7LXL8_9BACT|nr:hypothetical protein [Candidatus Sulfurimonas baltica]QOY53227.1 hypothetical protein HUE88_05985 [Candidatus Sulfurimonas baltica]
MNKQEIAKYANQLYVEMQINEMLPIEEYEIFVKPYYNTANWRFYEGKHQIVIGTEIFEHSKICDTTQQKVKYLSAFLYHELAHSIWTDKDLNKVDSILKKEDFSFDIFNLFEDARIEEKMRKHTKKSFNWIEFESLNKPINPLEIFFYILQCEHKKSDLENIKNIIPVHIFSMVFDYYKNVLACDSSDQIIEIMKNWYKSFPNTPKHINSLNKNGYLFSEEVKTFNNTEKFDELIEGLSNVLSTAGHNSQKNRDDKANINSMKSTGSLLYDEPVAVPFDIKQRDILLSKMEKLFFTRSRNQATNIPSKRLNIKRLTFGNEKKFRRKVAPDAYKKKITIILDLSGSMSLIIENMRLLIDVLDKMAAKNIIDATLILTETYSYEILPMPLKNGTIEHLVPAYGGEGMHNCMSSNIDLLSSSDFVWILTDGYIDEKPLNKEYFHKYNIITHAMYIGDISVKEEMGKSFDYVVCEENVTNLANMIFGMIK